MNDMQKLRILLTHWVEHNSKHAEELQQWTQRAEEFGAGEVASKLEAAAQEMKGLNATLEAARDLLREFAS